MVFLLASIRTTTLTLSSSYPPPIARVEKHTRARDGQCSFDPTMAEWLNAISRLGLRSQAKGEGNYRDAYEKKEKRHGQQLWEVRSDVLSLLIDILRK